MNNDFRQIASYIRENISLSSLISKYININKKGSNYISLCPFHSDNKPSLSISDTKKVWKCFSCNEAGDIIEFVKKKENLDYYQAIKKIIEIENIDLKSLGFSANFEAADPIKEEDKEFYDLIEFLTTKATTNLRLEYAKNQELRNFLDKRYLSYDSILNDFQIGFHPKTYTTKRMVEDLKVFYQKHLNKEVDEKIILANLRYVKYISDSDNSYFINRVIFPIRNKFNKVVGFSGRTISSNDDVKYINTPETDYFIKGDILYNYHALNFDNNNNILYICEGYMDVIALYRIGIKNAVAIMGTALTQHQIDLIKFKLNKINEIVLCLDNDEAGKNATTKCIKLLAANKIHKVSKLNYEGITQKDLDEVYHSDDGINRLKALINNKLSTKKEQENVAYLKTNDLSNQLYDEVSNEFDGFDDHKTKQPDDIYRFIYESPIDDKQLKSKIFNFVNAAISICEFYLIYADCYVYEDLSKARTNIVNKLNFYKPTRFFFLYFLQSVINNQNIDQLDDEDKIRAINFCYEFISNFLDSFTNIIYKNINSFYSKALKENKEKEPLDNLNQFIFNQIIEDFIKNVEMHFSKLDIFKDLKESLKSYINTAKNLRHFNKVNTQDKLNKLLRNCEVKENISKRNIVIKTKRDLLDLIKKYGLFMLVELKDLKMIKEVANSKEK
ncbi:DNA primase [Mycoplasma sp. E35C]|uniref:DNA primase n=1 Tax=Mycoplasma sp. E35C TaxID=2801918 RepID=UPI001CA40879|nr:DNA primase [Mycoplasma sp. E35C]QZX48835.1 DNA primase [Mycoplasma sp. E35C]